MEIIQVNNLTKKFPVYGKFAEFQGYKYVLRNVSFSLDSEKCLGIIGESGSGKTTLARLLTGLLQPDAGIIHLLGKDIREYCPKELSQTIQLIFQNPLSSLNPKLSVQTILSEAVAGSADSAGKISQVLKEVGLQENILRLYPGEISGGQAQRVAIARVLLKSAKIIIADEPLSALDVVTQAQIILLFQQLLQQHKINLIFISHDLLTTRYIAEQILVMSEGTVVEKGDCQKIFQYPQHPYTRKLLAANISL